MYNKNSFYREVVIEKLIKYVCLLYKIRNQKRFKYIHGWYAKKEKEMIGKPHGMVVARWLAMIYFPGLDQ